MLQTQHFLVDSAIDRRDNTAAKAVLNGLEQNGRATKASFEDKRLQVACDEANNLVSPGKVILNADSTLAVDSYRLCQRVLSHYQEDKMMFEQVFENLTKATESSVEMQKEMFEKWMEVFPTNMLGSSVPADAATRWLKKWEALSEDMLKRQKELVDENFDAGIKALSDLFEASDAKTPQDLQQKVVELYRKSFESIRHLSESQLNEFKGAMEKWTQLMTMNT